MAKTWRDGDAASADAGAPAGRKPAGLREWRERRLTDILHISELLQEAAAQLESEHALVRWLAQQIADPNSNSSSQQMRLESDKHLVQIVTIHKSKGLEYPLVWLPFIANFREADIALYHDREHYNAVLDLQNDEQSLALAEQRAAGGRFAPALCGADAFGLALQPGRCAAVSPPRQERAARAIFIRARWGG